MVDIIYGNTGTDIINGGGNKDIIYGNNGADTIDGGEGNDTIYGDDEGAIAGLYGNDTLIGGAGADTLYGGKGDDVLIGGRGLSPQPSDGENNKLYGGEGNDKLYGSGRLEGGKDFDTYFAYNTAAIKDEDGLGKVHIDIDGSLTLATGGIHKLGADDNTYQSVDGKITYVWDKEAKTLKVNDGLTIEDWENGELGINLTAGQDIAFVVDTTGSMGDEIDAVKANANAIIDMLFAYNRGMSDSRVAVVGYNDPSTQVFTQFTNQTTLEERKSVAKSAINSLSANDGGDLPEMLYKGLLTALNGSAGEWREDAQVKRIFLFGDAPGKDDHLASQVYQLAGVLGVSVRSMGMTRAHSEDIGVTTFSLENPINEKPPIKVEIYTILLGSESTASGQFSDISNTTGGQFISNSNATNIANQLYDLIQTGTKYDDISIGNENNNSYYGYDGNDNLTGLGGDDILDGGRGEDTMIGGQGNDTYYVDNANDKVIENVNEGYDAIFIANNFDLAGTNLEEIHLKGNGNFKAIGDAGDNGLYGNDGNNYLDGKAGADIMSGGAGNDYYIVDQYENLITNEDGTTEMKLGDQVAEGFLNGSFVSGDTGGIDTIEQWDDHRFYTQDENGNWTDTGRYHLLQTNVENVILKGSAKTAFGNNLDNIITLNEQNNFVNGLDGNDTIIYTKGGGQDSISFTDNISASDTLVIQGYNKEEVSFTQETDSLMIRFANSNDHIWLNDYFAKSQDKEIDNKVDKIIFKNNGQEVILTQNDIDNATVDRKDNHAPTVNKYPRNITVEDGDTISFKVDEDTIQDQDSWDSKLTYSITTADRQPLPDWLTFDPETLTLSGTPSSSEIGTHQFIIWGTDIFGIPAGTYMTVTVNASNSNEDSDATDPNTGDNGTNDDNESSNGNTDLSGDNTIKDTLGNDNLKGGAGNDTYIYTAGQDVLTDTQGTDKLIFSNGITFNQVASGLTMSNHNDLVLSVNGTSNQITLKNYFSDYDSIIETIEFETGGSLSHTQIFNLFGVSIPEDNSTTEPPPEPITITSDNDIIGTEANDSLKGSANTDRLQGLLGDDILEGQAGNDILVAGKGNDTLIGGEGNDLYYIESGFGNDTIINTGGGIDNIYFDGLGFNDIASGLEQVGDDLILKVSNSTDSLTLKDFFRGGEHAELNISFAAESYGISAEQLFGVFGDSNPDSSNTHSQAEYQSSLGTILGLMDEFDNHASSAASVI